MPLPRVLVCLVGLWLTAPSSAGAQAPMPVQLVYDPAAVAAEHESTVQQIAQLVAMARQIEEQIRLAEQSLQQLDWSNPQPITHYLRDIDRVLEDAFELAGGAEAFNAQLRETWRGYDAWYGRQDLGRYGDWARTTAGMLETAAAVNAAVIEAAPSGEDLVQLSADISNVESQLAALQAVADVAVMIERQLLNLGYLQASTADAQIAYYNQQLAREQLAREAEARWLDGFGDPPNVNHYPDHDSMRRHGGAIHQSYVDAYLSDPAIQQYYDDSRDGRTRGYIHHESGRRYRDQGGYLSGRDSEPLEDQSDAARTDSSDVDAQPAGGQ